MTGFLDNLRDYLNDLKDQELKKVIAQIPINELIEIWDDLDEDEELKLFRILDLERKVDLMDTLPISKQELLIRSLTGDHAKALLAEMDPDDLADFIQSVSPEVRESVWNALEDEAKEEALSGPISRWPRPSPGCARTCRTWKPSTTSTCWIPSNG
jgi:magnesium transporter